MSRRPSVSVALVLSGVLLLTGCGPKKSDSPVASGPTQSQSQVSPGDSGSAAPVASAATCPTSNVKTFAKTKFVLHTAEGFGAFHRYLYKPFKAGSFVKGSKGRIKSFIKAGLAALFIKRQVRLATEDVKANPTLCRLIAAPLAKLGDTISGAVTKLKGGDSSGIEQANTSISSIVSSAGNRGVPIKEDANPNLNG